jgi:3-phenylpropionate/cinnamic acid dioxygenase small subunit
MSSSELQAVHNLLGSYGMLLDRLIVEEWLDLFTDDAILDIDGNLLDSREKRRGLTASAPRGLHVSNLPVISGEPESDELSATSTFLFWNTRKRTTRLGWYDDALVRVDGGWRFAARRISFLDT